MTKYKVKATEPFPVCEGRNYVIDLPQKEWSNTAVVRCRDRLQDGDLLRLNSGSWLEVTIDKQSCFGYDGLLYGELTALCETDDTEKEVSDRRREGRVHSTIATYIR